MNGKTHKTIGAVAGAAFAMSLVYKTGEPAYTLLALVSPIGAMLPDIDHNNSKLGSARKFVVDVTTKIVSIAVVVAFIALFGYAYLTKDIKTGVLGALALGALMIFTVLTKSPALKKRVAFFRKHRGIMHTLFVPALLLCSGFVTESVIVNTICIGLAIGYLSHLMADYLTVSGVPLIWPLYKKDIHIPLVAITTGTGWEYFSATVLCGGIIWLATFIAR